LVILVDFVNFVYFVQIAEFLRCFRFQFVYFFGGLSRTAGSTRLFGCVPR